MKIVEQTADADSAPRSSVTIDNLFQRPQQRKDWRRLPRLIRQAFSLVRAAAGRTLLLVIISQLAMGIIAGLQILIAKQALTVILAGKPPTAMLSSLLPLLVVVAVSYTVARYAAAVQYEKTQVLIELVSNYTSAQVLDVAGRVNLAAFDDPSFYDRVQRAVHTGSVSTMGMVRGVVGVGGSAARVSGLLVALAVIKPVLLAPLVVIYIPMWYLIRRNSADSFHFFVGMTPLERRRDYMRMLLTDYASAKA